VALGLLGSILLMGTTLSRCKSLLVLALFVTVSYGNALLGDFVWDDNILIVDNTYIRNCTYVPAAFLTDLFHDYTVGVATHYRPLQTISFTMDYALWGLTPLAFHLTNLLLHLLCVVLVWLLMERLGLSRWMSLFVAGLFSVHPVNTNAISYISGRADPLALASMLGAFLLYIEHRKSGRLIFYLASMVCYLLALLSRESAMLFPLLLAAHSLLLSKDHSPRWRNALFTVLPYALLMISFAFWRAAVLEIQGKPLHTDWTFSLLVRIQVFFRALATYIGLIFWPAHLQMERQVVLGGLRLHLLTAAGVFISVVGLTLARWAYRHCRLALFGLIWFATTLMPVLGFLKLNATVAEHWLYCPAIGFFLAIVAAVSTLRDRIHWLHTLALNWFIRIVCISAILALMTRTFVRNLDWANPSSLYAVTKESAPYSAGVRCNLGHELINEGQPGRALTELLIAERLEPRYPRAKSNLAAFYIQQNNLSTARRYTMECLRLDSNNTIGLLQLAGIAEQEGNLYEARSSFLQAIGTTLDVRPRLQYGAFLVRQHQWLEAWRILREARSIEPGNAEVFNLIGVFFAENRQLEKAAESFAMARSLDRHSPNADMNLGRLATLRGDFPSAVSAYMRALQIQPNNVRARYQLALVYWQEGCLPLAQQHLQEMIRLMPNNPQIAETLKNIQRGLPYHATPSWKTL